VGGMEEVVAVRSMQVVNVKKPLMVPVAVTATVQAARMEVCVLLEANTWRQFGVAIALLV